MLIVLEGHGVHLSAFASPDSTEMGKFACLMHLPRSKELHPRRVVNPNNQTVNNPMVGQEATYYS